MAEEFVKRQEFEDFKKETREDMKAMQNQLKEGEILWYNIDKKVDSIITKLETTDNAEKTEKDLAEKIMDLKLKPVEDRVEKLEATKTWLLRLIVTEMVAIIGLIIKAAGVF